MIMVPDAKVSPLLTLLYCFLYELRRLLHGLRPFHQ